ncbi:MAG: hypothetical protein FD174_833 [Geobacteraceae bacterium]|nr:MAG: hypothetical protein FD174_833 [Geobacteraceae bacterium]
MSYKTGCLICGYELTCLPEAEKLACEYCGKRFSTDVCCINYHYVCDRCHSLSANDLIEQCCLTTRLTDPLKIAATLMKNPQIKVHGPEHHFLVPAVLLAAYYNATRDVSRKEGAIAKARARSEDVKGGFCGFHGACGAAIGTGIFVSLITGATPLAKQEWRLSNLMSATSLQVIAENGGPRCCKRDSFLAISAAANFVKEHFAVELPAEDRISCEFAILNRECLGAECRFYGG